MMGLYAFRPPQDAPASPSAWSRVRVTPFLTEFEEPREEDFIKGRDLKAFSGDDYCRERIK